MLVYVCTFFIVILLTYIAQILRKKSKYLSYGISIVCIIILATVAALRSNNVGIDIKVYALRYFEKCGEFSNLYKYLKHYEFSEPLYFILNYIVYNVSLNINVLFFIMQFFLASVVYIIAYKNKNNENLLLFVITYLCIWYNTSFNIIRQSLAIFIMLYAFKYIEKQNYKKYFLCVVIAFFFHKSVILCAFIPVLHTIAKKEKKYIYLTGICILLICIFNFIGNFIPKLIEIFPQFAKYFNYALREETNFMPKYAFMKLIFLVGILLYTKETRKKQIGNTLIFIAVLDFVFYCSSIFIMYGYRMSYFFLPHYIYLIPQIDKDLENYKGRDSYKLIITLLLVMYWFYRYVRVGYDGTIPYTFFWQ